MTYVRYDINKSKGPATRHPEQSQGPDLRHPSPARSGSYKLVEAVVRVVDGEADIWIRGFHIVASGLPFTRDRFDPVRRGKDVARGPPCKRRHFVVRAPSCDMQVLGPGTHENKHCVMGKSKISSSEVQPNHAVSRNIAPKAVFVALRRMLRPDEQLLLCCTSMLA